MPKAPKTAARPVHHDIDPPRTDTSRADIKSGKVVRETPVEPVPNFVPSSVEHPFGLNLPSPDAIPDVPMTRGVLADLDAANDVINNPRNPTDIDGVPYNPAVSHPMTSQGFPDNDGDMAPAPSIHPITGEEIEGVPKPPDIPDEDLPEEHRSDVSHHDKYVEANPTAIADDPTEPQGQLYVSAGIDHPDGPDARARRQRLEELEDENEEVDPYLGYPDDPEEEEKDDLFDPEEEDERGTDAP